MIFSHEIQKAPALLPAIKAAVDRDRKPGRFLLTGSADVLALPRTSESLAGRMEVVTLWPLSQGELRHRKERFVDAALAGEPPSVRGGEEDLVPCLVRGGYPEAVARPLARRRRSFFDSYVAGELTRQIGWSDARPVLHHFRTHAGQEVDLVLEDARGRVVGIEVKASATVTGADLAGLRALAEVAGKAFVQGIVLHLGRASVPFARNLTACPVEALWSA